MRRAPSVRIVAGMPWPAMCRHCDLVTEDPDAYFYPADWDEDDVADEHRCISPDALGGLHDPVTVQHLVDFWWTKAPRARRVTVK